MTTRRTSSSPSSNVAHNSFPNKAIDTNGSCLYPTPPQNDRRNVDDDEEHCRHCHSTALFTDWRQGDRVCTNCGVVAEEHIRDDRPEWKEFNEADDLAKGLPAAARCGMVPVDESKYLGGLQPTLLSKHPFGGTNSRGYAEAEVRKRLMATNRKLDHMMDKTHHKTLRDVKLHRSIRLKKSQQTEKEKGDDDIDDGFVPHPEYERLLLEEEEDVERMQTALYAEKWSLDRAILLHGSPDEQDEKASNTCSDKAEERERLLERMDTTLRKAAKDLYSAYYMLLQAARRLHLPDRVMNEATNRLVSYVVKRDGFCVKGVSSRLSKPRGGESLAQRKQAAERLRDHNKLKQIGALGSATLLLTARNLGWTRSVGEVCSSFVPEETASSTDIRSFIKPKHCWRALNELKTTFPDYARSMAMDPSTYHQAVNNADAVSNQPMDSTDNFADHSLRRLRLPPVAEASVSTLLAHCRNEQIHFGRNSGTKLSTLCASIAYFVCTAGSVMQRLAQQVKSHPSSVASTSQGKHPFKRRMNSSMKYPVTKKAKALKSANQWSTPDSLSNNVKADPTACRPDQSEDRTNLLGNDSTWGSSDDETRDNDNVDDNHDNIPFDVFSHAAIKEDQSEKLEYEMRRMWDAWTEQMPWSRSLGDVEQSCGVTGSVVHGFYKANLFPRRQELLQVLKDASADASTKQENGSKGRNSLQEAPFAQMLLSHISTAAPLMNTKGKA